MHRFGILCGFRQENAIGRNTLLYVTQLDGSGDDGHVCFTGMSTTYLEIYLKLGNLQRIIRKTDIRTYKKC